MPLVECLLGPAETPVFGNVYRFERDRFDRYVATVHDHRHIDVLTSVEHYRVVDDVPPSPPPAPDPQPPESPFIVGLGVPHLGQNAEPTTDTPVGEPAGQEAGDGAPDGAEGGPNDAGQTPEAMPSDPADAETDDAAPETADDQPSGEDTQPAEADTIGDEPTAGAEEAPPARRKRTRSKPKE